MGEEEEYQRAKEEAAVRRRNAIRKKYENTDAIEKRYVDESSGEEMPLYFQEPKQLLDIFTALEEQNLFLIQNSQETEQALEEVQQKFAETKRVMGSKAVKMKEQIAQLEKQIADEKAKCDDLRKTLNEKKGATEQDHLLKDLKASVLELHTSCGFDHDHDPNTLQMLGAIEERLKASLLRSQAPVHKKIGKQIMFRSAPLIKERKIVKEDDGFEDAERDHNVFGIWIAKDGIPNASQPVRPS